MMGSRRQFAWIVGAVILGIGAACDPFLSEEEDVVEVLPSPLVLTATSFPMEWLAKTIGGEAAKVNRLLPEGVDPDRFQPSGQALIDAAAGDLIVANGAGYEKWMMTATLPKTKVVETSAGQNLVKGASAKHAHGGGAAHSHQTVDPKTFTDPRLFLAQGEAVLKAMTGKAPGSQQVFMGNFEGMSKALKALNVSQEEALAPAQGLTLAANQPAYNYLAHAYGLNIRSFTFDPVKLPTSEALDKFEAWAAGIESPILFWAKMPTETVQRAFPKGTKHVFVDPLEFPKKSMNYDYLVQSWANIKTFQGLFGSTLLKAP